MKEETNELVSFHFVAVPKSLLVL